MISTRSCIPRDVFQPHLHPCFTPYRVFPLLLYHQPNEMLGCELEKQDPLKQTAIAGCVIQLLPPLPVLLHSPVLWCASSQLREALPQPYPAGRAPLWGQLMPAKQKWFFFFFPVSLGYVIEGGVAAVLFGSAAPARFCQHTTVSSGASFFPCFQPAQLH